MPENPSSYISRFKPTSHFFAEPAGISQSSAQAFGPVTGNEANAYRITTKFTATTSKAFAICKGVVLVQPQSGNANKINLILKPYIQPIAGFNIKYFVYRGLNITDFFSGSKVIKPATNTSDLVNKMNASFNSFHQKVSPGQAVPDFLAKYIGFDPTTQGDSLPLSSFFFKDSQYVDSNGEFVEAAEQAFELPLIDKGMSIGNFVPGECGIDVVIDYGAYQLSTPNDEFVFDLAYARAQEAKIELTGGLTDYQKKLKREQIFQFLDVAAYFGFHATAEGAVSLNQNGTIVNKKGQDIYTDIVSKFATKNKLYLYIQSDRTRSYNFYGNYTISTENSNELKIGATSASMAETTYQSHSWPLLIDSSVQNHSDVDNNLWLQFTKTPYYTNAALYGQVANIANAQHNNFCDAENLSLPENPDGTAVAFTKPVQLTNPSTGPNGAKVNVATFNILIYQGKEYSFLAGTELDEDNIPMSVYAVPNFFDDVFDNLTATPLIKGDENPLYSVVSHQKLKLINHYYNRKQYGISAVQTTKIHDAIKSDDLLVPLLKRVTYLSETIDSLNNAIAIGGKISNDTKSSASMVGSATSNYTYELPPPFYYERVLFTDSTETITGLKLKSIDETLPDRIILGLSEAEDQTLLDLIDTNTLINARLFLVDLFEDGNELISAENIVYQKYTVGMVGEKPDGELELFKPEEEVVVYSLDRRYNYSARYSKYVKDFINIELAMDLDIAL